MMKDWTLEAAREIASATMSADVPIANTRGVHAIITKHCPFEPDVAYMRVPRCETCRWWGGPQQFASGERQCTEPTISPDQNEEFMTLPNFGCTQWESK